MQNTPICNDATNPPTHLQTNLFHRRAMHLAGRNPALAAKLQQMRLKIAPIVNVANGLPPSTFPSTMLHLFLLTEKDLDLMAEYYSQTNPNPTPTSLTFAYPSTMDWNRELLQVDPTLPANCQLSDEERLKIKMRMFARFIGMRGAETPRWEYERGVEILANRIEHRVRGEEQEEMRRKIFMGPRAWRS